MNKLIKYGGYVLGISLLLSMIFPHLFFPAGVICMTGLIGIFTQTCAKNVSGASKIYIAEKAISTAFTITNHEISAVSIAASFMRVDIVQDSLQWLEESKPVGINNIMISNKIDFDVQPAATATNAFRQSLMDASPCGLYAIILDDNGACWLVGVNEVDVYARPLRFGGDKKDTGKGLAAAEGNLVHITLQNDCSGVAMKFATAINTTILAGTDTCLKTS
jgi:hypothetical protein